MKKSIKGYIVLFLIVSFVITISGCIDNSGGSKEFKNNNISFSYPSDWNLSDSSDSTDIILGLEGSGLVVGSVYSDQLLSGQTVADYISENFNELAWNSPKDLNGHTYYEGFQAATNNPNMVYNKGIFVNGNIIYVIAVNGDDSKVTDGFYKIRDSFKIK